MRYALTCTEKPTSLPVTLDEARLHLKEPHEDDNPLILAMIAAATDLCETFTRRQFMTATYEMRLDGFPSMIRVPRPPLQEVVSIVYSDSAGSQTLSSSDYIVDTHSEPGRITTTFAGTWPVTYRELNAVTITFKAGWSKVGDVPEALRAAIKLLVGDMYQHREVATDKPVNEMPAVKALLMAHLVEWWG